MKYPSMCYIKIKNGSIYLYTMAGDKVFAIKVKISEWVGTVSERVLELTDTAKTQLLSIKDAVKEKANDRGVQVAAAGSIGGGTTGLATGTVIGAVAGIVPALFTFGLSIPIGAVIGGTMGTA